MTQPHPQHQAMLQQIPSSNQMSMSTHHHGHQHIFNQSSTQQEIQLHEFC